MKRRIGMHFYEDGVSDGKTHIHIADREFIEKMERLLRNVEKSTPKKSEHKGTDDETAA